jgi:hypothetical protein
LKQLLANWQEWAPIGAIIAVAAVGFFFWLRRKPEDAQKMERERRAYLNRVGRIVEGHILEFMDAPHAAKETKGGRAFVPPRAASHNGTQKLLYYTYSISGVTYETAQDVTGMEERLHVARVAAGQTASVKYDPSNPSNSILLADDWSGLH